jgi:heme A synthase
MRNAYRGLAFAIAALVALQAAFIAFALSGLVAWVQEGGTLDASTFTEGSDVEVGGSTGFMLHALTGMFLIPLLALVLLIISFFAKIPGGVKWAAIVFGVVVLQYALALLTRTTGTPFLGALHGLNALILFGVAVTTAMRVRTRATRSVDATSVSAV